MANFTIASTPRNFDRAANEWKDGDALFLRESVWREFAEHVAGSLTKGMTAQVARAVEARGARHTNTAPTASEEPWQTPGAQAATDPWSMSGGSGDEKPF